MQSVAITTKLCNIDSYSVYSIPPCHTLSVSCVVFVVIDMLTLNKTYLILLIPPCHTLSVSCVVFVVIDMLTLNKTYLILLKLDCFLCKPAFLSHNNYI